MSSTMKAMVYYGSHDIRFEERPKAQIKDQTDAVVRLTKFTICGTDLGIYKGKNPEIEERGEHNEKGEFIGRILGHEGIGIVESVGSEVKNVKPGDKVIISCISRCGKCDYCQKQLYAHCENGGGWILGYMIDGTHAEYVRTPFADTSLYKIPAELDEEVGVFLSDVLPTSHEIGVKDGKVRPGDTICIVGAGAIGLGALLTSQFYSPEKIIMVDLDTNRLEQSMEMGATHTVVAGPDAVEKIMEITGGKGVDVAIECVGYPATFNICQEIVKPGGHIANVGVHGSPVELQIQKLWIKNLTITMGLVNADTTAMLIKSCTSGKLPMKKLATHRFDFSELEKAYDTFIHGAEHKCVKVIVNVPEK